MSNEALLLLALQGVLGLLSAVGLRWTSSMKQDVSEIRRDQRKDSERVTALEVRVDGIEGTSDHDQGVTDTRLDRVSSVTSDLRMAVGRLESQIAMCPNCAQPRIGQPR